jgi:hypothetical protein
MKTIDLVGEGQVPSEKTEISYFEIHDRCEKAFHSHRPPC